MTAEEEDELLYGDNIELNTVDSVFTDADKDQNKTESWVDSDAKGRYWLILTRQSGNLEFYTLPDCELRFKDKNFASAPRVIESGRFEGAEGRRGDVPLGIHIS